MKLKAWFSLSVLLFSFSKAFTAPKQKTAPTKTTEYVLDFKSFRELPHPEKISYLKNLQDFVVKADFSKDPRLKVSLIELFLESSFAVDDQSPCIFAGFLMNMKQNRGGKWYCPKPDRGDCPVGKVPCNPLVFGKDPGSKGSRDICVGQPYSDATEQCLRASDKSLDAVVDRLDPKSQSYDAALAGGWDYFRKGVNSYCASPFPFNAQNCAFLLEQFRLIKEKMNPTYTVPDSGTR